MSARTRGSQKRTRHRRPPSPSWALPPAWEGSLLALAALITTFYRIGHTSLWADEGNSAAQAMRPLGELIRRAALDIHPPLYYVLLHLWAQIFGTSEGALRALSALFAVGTVLLLWLTTRILWGQGTARVAGLLAALHPFLVYYAQEARMYTLLVFWAVLAVYAFLRIVLKEGRARLALLDAGHRSFSPEGGVLATLSPHHPALQLGRWDLVYILAVAAGLWTHYIFPLIPLLLVLAYTGWILSTRRTLPWLPRVIRLLTDHLAALLLFLPWLPILLRRTGAWPHPKDVLPLEKGVMTAFRWLAVGPLLPAGLSRWLWVWAALLIVALWPWRRAGVMGRRRAHWLSWGLPLGWLVAPIALLAGLNIFRVAYLKFLLIALPPFLILIARGNLALWDTFARARKRWQFVALTWAGVTLLIVLLGQLRGLAYYYTHPDQARDDYRGIVRYVEAIASPEDAIILNAPGQWDVFCYYYPGCDPLQDPGSAPRVAGYPPVYALPQERPPHPDRLRARLEEIAREHRKLFVLLWGTGESDPENIVETWLDRHTYKALDVWRGHVRFLIYATPRSRSENALVRPVGARLGNAVELEEMVLLNPRVSPGDVVQIGLRWRVLHPLGERYKVFVQILGPGDRLVAQRDSEPVGGSRPTSSWKPGDVVEDHYGVLIPLGTPPGTYRIITGMYNANTGQRLPVTLAGWKGDFVELPTHVQVQRPTFPPPEEVLPIRHRVHERWGPLVLLGYTMYKRGYAHAPDTPLHPGDFLHLTLFWKAVEPPQDRWRVTVNMVDGWGNVVASVTDDPAGPTYPTTEWARGEVVRGEFDMYIPPETKPDTYGLQIQLWKGDTPVRKPVPLGAVTLEKHGR